MNTKIMKLRHLEEFYGHAESMYVNESFDEALASFDIEKISSVLESFFIALCNKAHRTQADEKKWQTAYRFITDVVTLISKGKATQNTLSEVLTRLQHLGFLYQQLHVQGPARQEPLRSLPANVVEAIYNILDPESANNPFKREKTRWMVLVIFVVLLHEGFRRGELLLQLVSAVKSSFDKNKNRQRYWLNVRHLDSKIHDPRFNKPSIKNESSIRQVPVSEFTANIIQTYIENYRGKTNHPFLLNSARDTPLSMEGLNVLFKKISDALPKNVIRELEDRTGKTSITPHDLRHTCAVVRLNQLLSSGDEMDLALQKLRSFFGWSRTSDMPQKYAKAVFEDRLSEVWSNVFDDRIAILRAIPKGR